MYRNKHREVRNNIGFTLTFINTFLLVFASLATTFTDTMHIFSLDSNFTDIIIATHSLFANEISKCFIQHAQYTHVKIFSDK